MDRQGVASLSNRRLSRCALTEWFDGHRVDEALFVVSRFASTVRRAPGSVSVQGGSGCDAEDIEDAKARHEATG